MIKELFAPEALDKICSDHYKTRDSEAINAVLEANPGLAGLGLMLPAGTRLVLPELEPPKPEAIQLF